MPINTLKRYRAVCLLVGAEHVEWSQFIIESLYNILFDQKTAAAAAAAHEVDESEAGKL